MDSFDRKILEQLRCNARMSISAIAEQVNLSRPAVSDRIKRMEERGEILGYQVITAAETPVSSQLKAYLEIRHGGYHCAPVAALLMQYPEVKFCHGTVGDVDLIVHLEFDSMERLDHILETATTQLPQNARIVTHMVIREWQR